MGHVQINLFGSFHVERDGKSVDEQLARSPKGMLLMQYLILAPRQTAEAKTLMQVMWPEENSTSPDTALKTLIRLVVSARCCGKSPPNWQCVW